MKLGDQHMIALYSLPQPQFLALYNGDPALGRSRVCALGAHALRRAVLGRNHTAHVRVIRSCRAPVDFILFFPRETIVAPLPSLECFPPRVWDPSFKLAAKGQAL